MKTQSLFLALKKTVYFSVLHYLEAQFSFQCADPPPSPSLRGNAFKSLLRSFFLMFSRRLDLSEFATISFYAVFKDLNE